MPFLGGFKHTGFSLLELMVVLGIIALAVAIVLPRLGSFEGRDFRVKVREAKALLEYARRTAIVQGQTIDAVFLQHNKKDKTGIKTLDAETLAQDLIWQSQTIRLSYNQRILEDGEMVRISFFPEGGSTAGDLRFQQGVLSLAVQIDGMTGRIRFVDEE